MNELLRVAGSHEQVGWQIGVAMSGKIHDMVTSARAELPPGLSWEDCQNIAIHQYLPQTDVYFRQQVDLIRAAAAGAAENGADVSFSELFAIAIDEELNNQSALSRASRLPYRCSDIAVTGRRSAHRKTIVGHNNDLSPSTRKIMAAVEMTFPEVTVFSVGLAGVFMSVSLNSYGVGIAGDEMSNNDSIPDLDELPRYITARQMAEERTPSDAMRINVLRPRAGSYANLIFDSTEAFIVEASATDEELIFPDDGVIVHANTFVHQRMLQYEGRPDHVSSKERYLRLRKRAVRAPRSMTDDDVKSMLSDHGEDRKPSNSTVCRHENPGTNDPMTGFSVVFDMGRGRGTVDLALGPPCTTEFVTIWERP